MQIKNIMQKELITVPPDATIRDAARKMRDCNVGCVIVVNSEHLKGFVTDRDITCWLAEGKNPDEAKVESIMRKNVITTTPDTDIFDASKLMAHNSVRRLPVVEEDGRVCGLVTTADIAPLLEEEIDNFLHLEEAYRH